MQRAFGNHFRRAHLAAVVVQRHCQVSRVDQHHIGFWHTRHHALAHHLPPFLQNALAYHRVAFTLLHLLFHFLLGHLESVR